MSYFVIKSGYGKMIYQVGDLSLYPNGQWSGAEHRKLKFYDKQSGEDFMQLMEFGEGKWLCGKPIEIEEIEEGESLS